MRIDTYLGTKNLAHILANTSIIPLSILMPVNAVNASPSNNNTRLLAKFARPIFLIAKASANVPDLLGLDFATVVVKGTRFLWRFAHLDFEVSDYTVIVLAKTLTLDVTHLGHHRFCFAQYLGSLCGTFFVGRLIDVAHRYVRMLEADWRR